MPHKILIIEDELLLSNTLQLNLELEGYNALTCNDGLLAVEAIQNTKPDLILLDMMLPNVNGSQILQKLNELHISTPVIFLTAKSNSNDKINTRFST